MGNIKQSAGSELYDTLTGQNGLGFNPHFKYVFNNKVYPGRKNATVSTSFDFNGMKFANTSETVIFNTDFNKNIYFKCILYVNDYDLTIRIKGHSVNGNIIPLDKVAQILIKNTNIQGVIWEINEEMLNGLEIAQTFSDEGCDYIYAWGLLLNKEVVYKCYLSLFRTFQSQTQIPTFRNQK